MKNKHFLSEKAFQRNVDYFAKHGYIFRKTEDGYDFIPTEEKTREVIAMNKAIGIRVRKDMDNMLKGY